VAKGKVEVSLFARVRVGNVGGFVSKELKECVVLSM
jgi:hypothetical protein